MRKKFQFSKLNSDFIRKFSDLQLSAKFVNIGAQKCAKFQRNPARNFRSGNFSDFFHFKNFFFAELQELEHSAEGTFFRKIGNFSTFSTNSKIPKIYLSGPISVQSFSKKYFLKKVASKQWDFEQKFPILKLEIGFIRKIFQFSIFYENSEILSI